MSELAIRCLGVHPSAEPADHRREVERRPDPADVHVAHACVGVEAARTHLVEPERLDLDGLGASAGDRVLSDLEVPLALELPDLVTLLGHDDLGRALLECAREASLEHVRRLDEVVIDRDQRV